jgi:hypothetical protein
MLTEFMGQAYEPSDDGREAFLLLDGELNRASGKPLPSEENTLSS